MNSSINHKIARAKDLWFDDQKMIILLEDGREISIPLEWFPRLRDATSEERNQWRFIGNGIGIHWELLDEDISVKGLLN